MRSGIRNKRNWMEEFDVHDARRERAEYHGRSWEEARELRWQAAKSAAVCGECFRPLAATDSVTMEWRLIGGSRRANNEHWVRVPICLSCTLDKMLRPFHSEPHWHRARCLYCGRPLRLHRPERIRRWLSLFDIRLPWTPSLNAQTCCTDCERLARNKRNADRRRVEQEPRTCIECGRAFIPTRADAVTCSNRCRQAQHRKLAGASGGVKYPLRRPPARGQRRAAR